MNSPSGLRNGQVGIFFRFKFHIFLNDYNKYIFLPLELLNSLMATLRINSPGLYENHPPPLSLLFGFIFLFRDK